MSLASSSLDDTEQNTSQFSHSKMVTTVSVAMCVYIKVVKCICLIVIVQALHTVV